jgi:hypothetical protein
MLNLVLTTDKLQLSTSSAATVDVHASFIDLSGTTITPGKQNTAIAGIATTDIVAAPSSGTRNVKTLHIRNKDASLSVNVIVIFDANGTDYELHGATIAPGQSLEYVEGIGFFLIQSTAKLNKMLYVTSNSVHATAATFAVITGLSTPVLSGKKYAIECALFHISNATTTGAQFGFGGVAMTAMIGGAISTVTNSPTAATMSTGVATAVNTAFVVQTTGAAANAPTWVAGWIQPSADGTFEMRATSEVTVANGLTVLKGSWMHIRETDN